MKFPNGVGWYTKGVATVKVYFPENKVACRYCKFMVNDPGCSRTKCFLTEEILVDPKDWTGNKCPLERVFESEEK